MKNHQVNNDYVQNLQEGLLTEAALRMGKKEKGAKPRQTHVGEEDNMGNVATNSARRKNIKDGTPKAAATHKRIMKKLRSAGGGEEYDRKEAEAKADVERKRLEAAPALASMQK